MQLYRGDDGLAPNKRSAQAI